jgi:ABC-type cobalamin transport system ATPase subunit
MALQPDILELIDQQQHDRRQLLLYAERLDVISDELQRHAETIERLTEHLAGGEAERVRLVEAHAVEVAELRARQELDAAALVELRAWREAMERSRTYRLMQRLAALDRLPLIGPALRALRQALSRGLS